MYTAILHATDLSGNHFHMCQQAMEIAKRFNAKFYLIHVIEVPPSIQLAQGLGFAELDSPVEIKRDAEAVMAVLGDALGIPLNHQFVEVGSIKTHVLKKMSELHCNLIVLGRHTPSKLPNCLGSTAHYLVQTATCDVLTLSMV